MTFPVYRQNTGRRAKTSPWQGARALLSACTVSPGRLPAVLYISPWRASWGLLHGRGGALLLLIAGRVGKSPAPRWGNFCVYVLPAGGPAPLRACIWISAELGAPPRSPGFSDRKKITRGLSADLFRRCRVFFCALQRSDCRQPVPLVLIPRKIKRACPFPGQPSACKDNIVLWPLASCRCLKIKVKTVAVNLVYHSVFVGLQSLGKLARVV